MAAVTICSDFGTQEKKSLTVSIVSPSICHEVMGPDAVNGSGRHNSVRYTTGREGCLQIFRVISNTDVLIVPVPGVIGRAFVDLSLSLFILLQSTQFFS